jgi:hypothetical protein
MKTEETETLTIDIVLHGKKSKARKKYVRYNKRDLYLPEKTREELRQIDQFMMFVEAANKLSGYKKKAFNSAESKFETPLAEFLWHLEKWHQETDLQSMISKIITHPSYYRMINLGGDFLHIILTDLRDRQGYWFPALYAITGVQLEIDELDFEEAAQKWIEWGHSKNIHV